MESFGPVLMAMPGPLNAILAERETVKPRISEWFAAWRGLRPPACPPVPPAARAPACCLVVPVSAEASAWGDAALSQART